MGVYRSIPVTSLTTVNFRIAFSAIWTHTKTNLITLKSHILISANGFGEGFKNVKSGEEDHSRYLASTFENKSYNSM